jgi:hypothetical protein
MINCIINFFSMKQKDKTLFSEQYRIGYKKLWIDNLRDYKP